jgi:hypothetical protein
MRQININGQTFEVRSLRRAEINKKQFRQLGYGRFVFTPELGDGDTQERLAEIMDVALLAVLGQEGCAAVDAAGGVRGLQAAWRAIVDETYGTAGAEKNSSGAGSGSATPGAATTAPHAAAASAAPDATTDDRPS